MTDLVTTYLECWNEPDPEARRALIERSFSEQATYVDPLVDVRGHDAIDATIAAVQGQFPGFAFSAAGPADAHHNLARFGWTLGPADDHAPVAGFDVVVLAEDGRIEAVHGFLDRLPSDPR